MIHFAAKLLLFACLAVFTLPAAYAFSPPITFKSIKPVANGNLELGFEVRGQAISILDDDGMGSLMALDYHLSAKRGQLSEEKSWEAIKNQPAENYDVVYPFIISQYTRLLKNYRQWANEATTSEAKQAYGRSAGDLETFLPKLKKAPAATNATMSELHLMLYKMSEVHSYSGSINGMRKKGLSISGRDNPVAQSFSSLGSMCEAQSIVENLPALLSVANGGAAGAGDGDGAKAIKEN